MSEYLIQGDTLTAIADAIRGKTETTDRMLPEEMAAAIRAIETGIAIPNWATEIELAQVTVTTTSNELNVPCSMSSVPTKHILLCTVIPNPYSSYAHRAEISYVYKQKKSSTSTTTTSYTWSFVPGISYGDNVITSYAVGTWTLSGGIATLTATETSAYYAGTTYMVIMWR